jgi:hypothetical protein
MHFSIDLAATKQLNVSEHDQSVDTVRSFIQQQTHSTPALLAILPIKFRLSNLQRYSDTYVRNMYRENVCLDEY